MSVDMVVDLRNYAICMTSARYWLPRCKGQHNVLAGKVVQVVQH
jgi:hypothetical protein